MKLEINLRDAANEPSVARPLAVALLCTLPQDEAELAVNEWRSVLAVRLADDVAHLETAAIVEAAPQPEAEPVAEPAAELAVEPDGETAVHAGTRLEDCLSPKAANPLKKAGFQVLGDLERCSGQRLLNSVDRFGKGGLEELESTLAKAGLALAVDDGLASKPKTESPAFLQEPDETPPEPAEMQPEPAAVQLELWSNGEDPYVKMDLRELCRHAERQIGRDKVVALFRKHGAVTLSNVIGTDLESNFRADIVAALA